MGKNNAEDQKLQLEFAVQIKSEDCVRAVREKLQGLGQVKIDREKGHVIIKTTTPWHIVQTEIESTGRKAVLSGFGGQSAVAMINTSGSDVNHKASAIQGIVRFSAITKDEPGVVVDGVIDGLKPGLHGIHVHESGDVSNGCESLGGHYNPRNSPHGAPDDSPDRRHLGDLGNIRSSDDHRATFRFVDPMLEVSDIIGRSVVVTENADDYGRGGNEKSLIDGNSGRRLACGIIARSAGIYQNFKKICACDGVTLWDERDKPLAGSGRSQKL